MTIKIMPVRMTIIIVTTLVVSEATDVTTDITCCGSIFLSLSAMTSWEYPSWVDQCNSCV